jgi:uncharacterized protein (TIGR00255 family)
MIHSMTAFARAESKGDHGTLCFELRSVNHRYLELSLRLPDELRALEPSLRERAGQRLARGKVEISLRYQRREGAVAPEVNETALKALIAACRSVDHVTGHLTPLDALELLRLPGVLKAAENDSAALAEQALAAFDAALEALAKTRASEGERLAALILTRCDGCVEQSARARIRRPVVLKEQQDKLRARIAELGVAADPARLEQEIALLAQRLDVAEELDRLEMHLDEVRKVLGKGGGVGRRLDFLMQELNREANTLGSKSSDVETTRAAVELKVLIEQMREQVQNIE